MLLSSSCLPQLPEAAQGEPYLALVPCCCWLMENRAGLVQAHHTWCSTDPKPEGLAQSSAAFPEPSQSHTPLLPFPALPSCPAHVCIPQLKHKCRSFANYGSSAGPLALCARGFSHLPRPQGAATLSSSFSASPCSPARARKSAGSSNGKCPVTG